MPRVRNIVPMVADGVSRRNRDYGIGNRPYPASSARGLAPSLTESRKLRSPRVWGCIHRVTTTFNVAKDRDSPLRVADPPRGAVSRSSWLVGTQLSKHYDVVS